MGGSGQRARLGVGKHTEVMRVAARTAHDARWHCLSQLLNIEVHKARGARDGGRRTTVRAGGNILQPPSAVPMRALVPSSRRHGPPTPPCCAHLPVRTLGAREESVDDLSTSVVARAECRVDAPEAVVHALAAVLPLHIP